MRRSVAFLLACFALEAVSAPPASAQVPQPARRRVVTMSAKCVFGNDVLLPYAWNTLWIEAQNHTARTFRGAVEVSVSSYQSRAERYTHRLDLAPHARRRVLIEVFVPEGASIHARYEADDAVLTRAVVNVPYSPASEAIVVLADPPRLRAALVDMDVTQQDLGPYGGPRQVRVPVGTVSFDAATADPVLPTRAPGWSAVGLLVASAADLARVGAAEQQALTNWIQSGGRLLVFVRSDADFREPFLRSLAGDVERFESSETVANERLVPEGSRGRYLRGNDETFRTESFGGSRRVGFGRVYVAVYDGMSPSTVTAPEPRLLVRSVLEAPTNLGVDRPKLPFGRGLDDLGRPDYWSGTQTFGYLRAALDPNEGYRPALGLVAVVLLLYVIVVGPLNFMFVGKRNRPTMALVTTPVAAFSCLLVMLGVGYIGKGTKMRYRAVSLVELAEGESTGPSRRYTGFFLTRPASFELDAPPRGMARVVRGPTADIDPITDHGAETPVLRDLRGRLWETVFVREDELVDMGGRVVFERDGRRLAAVRNETAHALRGAVVIDSGGNVYRVGDVAVGERRPIAQVAEATLATPGYWGGPTSDPSIVSLTRIMGLPREREPALAGTNVVLGGFVSPPVPTLLAWRSSGDERRDVAGFARELDLSFVRVVPDLGTPEVPAAADLYEEPFGEEW